MVDKEKFAEEEALGYNINIVGKNVLVTEAMKNYAWDKLTKIERFHNRIMDAHVNMDIKRVEHSVDIILTIDHLKVKVSASSTDMYASIDKAIDKLQNTLRRWKSRIQDHHKKGVAIIDMEVNVLRRPQNYDELSEFNADIEIENKKEEEAALHIPQIIGNETRPLKMLRTDEAVMKLELSGDQFLIFRDEADQKIKVIYRRNDGDYGLIKPE
jgi:putative sigma-54 modulation protein